MFLDIYLVLLLLGGCTWIADTGWVPTILMCLTKYQIMGWKKNCQNDVLDYCIV